MEENEWRQLVDEQKQAAYRAFVGLGVHKQGGPPGEAYHLISGFVFSVHDRWVWVSSAHAFVGHGDDRGLFALMEEFPETKIELQPVSQTKSKPTFFSIFRNNWITIDSIAEELKDRIPAGDYQALKDSDLIAVILPELYVQNLQAEGVKPFTWTQVCDMPDDEHMELLRGRTLTIMILGVPSSGSLFNHVSGLTSLQILCLPIEPASESLPFSYWHPTWSDQELSHNVVGTSGGPIMLLGAHQPFIMGVQISQKKANGNVVYKSVSGYFFFDIIAKLIKLDYPDQS